MQCMLQNILKEVIFWALLASGDFHKNEVQCPRKALLGDAWSEILAGLSELLTSLCRGPEARSDDCLRHQQRQHQSLLGQESPLTNEMKLRL